MTPRSEPRRYLLLDTLGRGGFGTVYRARLLGQGGFSKEVALKIPNASSATGPRLGRLRDEARILSMLRHRAIVSVDELAVFEGRWSIVMEYVDGANLEVIRRAMGAVPPSIALAIVEEAASALDAAYHALGPDGQPLRLLHRDIKPSNLVLTAAGDLKVLDFGIAWAAFSGRESVTRDTGHFGSLGYMAPERIDALDHARSDVFSLGVVLYELLVGEQLGKTFANRARADEVRSRALRELSAMVGRTAVEVVDLVADMLAFEPDQRPSHREVEVRARTIKERLGTPRLRDWAAEHVERMAAAPSESPTAEFATGAVLEEREVELLPEPFSATTLAPGRRSAPSVRALVAIAVVCAVLTLAAVVAAALSAGRLLTSPAPVPHEPEPAEAAVEPAPPAEAPVPAPAPDPEPAEAAAAPEPAPPVVSRARPAGPAVPAGTPVRLSGEATAVVLVAGDARHVLPGVVPGGTYTIEAAFPGLERARVGAVEIAGASELTVHCDAIFAVCELRP